MSYLLHPLAQKDVFEILDHYELTAGEDVADQFFEEIDRKLNFAAKHPERQHRDTSLFVHRVNLRKFPYHFLFTRKGDAIFVFVVRHNKRNPTFGKRRKRP